MHIGGFMSYIGRHTPKHEGKKGNPEFRLRGGELFDPFRKTGRGGQLSWLKMRVRSPLIPSTDLTGVKDDKFPV